MKYCFNYAKHSQYLDTVDEITIKLNNTDQIKIKDFLLAHSKQKINIYITSVKDFIDYNLIDSFIKIREEYPDLNFSFVTNDFNFSSANELIPIFEKNKFPFFSKFAISDWDTLYGYLNFGVSEVYIAEDLGFELDKVANVVHSYNAKVRVYPNVCQTSWKGTFPLKTFFIRPEDVIFYKPYVDVLELYGDSKSIDAKYKIYAIDKKWFGNLKDLLIGFDMDLDSRFVIVPTFAVKRIRCNKKCLKGSNCKLCERIVELSHTLKDNNLMVEINNNN